jgi:hypothetical protein
VRHAPAAPLENECACLKAADGGGWVYSLFLLLLTRRVSTAKSQGQAADEEGVGCHESSGKLNQGIEKGIVNIETLL